MRFLFGVCLALLASVPAHGDTVKIGQIMWQTNYDEARKLAARQGKLLWLHFGENPG